MSSWLKRLRGEPDPADEAEAEGRVALPVGEPSAAGATSPDTDSGGEAALAGGNRVERFTCRVFAADGSGDVEYETIDERVSDLLNRVGDAEIDGVLLVLPPPQEGNPQRRLHRPGQPIRIRVGPYLAEGQLHVPPGAQAMGFLGRLNPRFVPLTEAAIRRDGDDGELTAPVVLVNLHLAERVTEVTDADLERPASPASPPSSPASRP